MDTNAASKFCLYFGIISIPLSIVFWFFAPNFGATQFESIADPAMREVFKLAHSERWGIFVGLWPSTLLMLSQILKAK